MRTARLALLVLLVVLVAALGQRPRVSEAHAVLERSVPASNQQLSEAPAQVETWYSEPLERSLTKLEVLDTQGGTVHAGDTQFSDDPNHAAVALPPDLAPGIYTVTYQNVSTVDGHQWSGFFTFVVLNPDGSVPAGQALTPEGFEAGGGGQGFLPGIGDTTLRWFGLLAAAALVGSFVFYVLVARPAAQFLQNGDQRRVDEAAMATAADVSLLALPLLLIAVAGQALLLADRIGGPDAIDEVLFDTRTGSLWLVRAGLAAALLVVLSPSLVAGRFRSGLSAAGGAVLALLLGLGVLITYSLGSHASAGGGEFWSVGSDFVHFVAIGAWVGGLLHLGLAFWWTRESLREPNRLLYQANVLDRFSWLAAISVTLIIGTGVFNSFVELPTAESFWETTYGRTLIVKLGLVLPLLGVAGLNAFLLKPALVRAVDEAYGEGEHSNPGPEPEPAAGSRLGRLRWLLPRTTALEFALAAAVLAATGILTQTTPAEGELRQAQSAAPQPFSFTQTSGDLKLRLTVAPFNVGVNTFTVELEPPEAGGTIGEVVQVQLRTTPYDPVNLTEPLGGPSSPELLEPQGDNRYSFEGSLLNQPAHWRTLVEVRRRGVDDVRSSFGLHLVPPGAGEQTPGLFEVPFAAADWNVVVGALLCALGISALVIWRNRPPSWERDAGRALAISGAFAVAAGLFFMFGLQEGPADANPIERSQESIARGQLLYQQNCMVCHGPSGQGDGPQASRLSVPPANLTDHVPSHPDITLFRVMTDGIAGISGQNMPGFGETLTEEERWHILNFLRETFGDFQREFTPVRPEDSAPGQVTK